MSVPITKLYHFQKEQFNGILQNSRSKSFHKSHIKILIIGSALSKASLKEPAIILYKKLVCWYFPLNLTNFFSNSHILCQKYCFCIKRCLSLHYFTSQRGIKLVVIITVTAKKNSKIFYFFQQAILSTMMTNSKKHRRQMKRQLKLKMTMVLPKMTTLMTVAMAESLKFQTKIKMTNQKMVMKIMT